MKRLAAAAVLAVLLHIVVFRLEMPWARPTPRLQSRDAVAISLVTAPRPAPQTQIQPIALPAPKKVKPLARLAEKTQAKPLPRPEPPPQHSETFEPVPPPGEEGPPNIDENDRHELEDDGQAADPPGEKSGAVRETIDTPGQTRQDASAGVQVSIPLHDLNPPLSYPPLAVRRGYAGTVLLKVLVSSEGRPLRIEIEASSGHGILDRDAVAEVRRWRFKPALHGGRPVEMWIRQPVTYRLE